MAQMVPLAPGAPGGQWLWFFHGVNLSGAPARSIWEAKSAQEILQLSPVLLLQVKSQDHQWENLVHSRVAATPAELGAQNYLVDLGDSEHLVKI